MGWATDLQQASFRQIEFECVSTKDAVNRSLAVHQAPYSNSAFVEDLGSDPRNIALRIFLEGSDYKLYLDALEIAFNLKGTGELVHPIFGVKNVHVANYSVDHDTDLVDGCYIDANFLVAQTKPQLLFIPTRLPDKINYVQAFGAPANAFKKELEQLQQKDPNKFLVLVNRVRNGLQRARKILGIIRTTADDILSPPDWAQGLVDDVSRLVNFDVTDISAISKWRGLAAQVKRISNVFDDDDSANDSPAFKQLWRAVTVSCVVGTAQAITDNVRGQMATNNNNASLSPPELAVIRQQVRGDIQTAIQTERETTPEQAASSNIDPAAQVAVYKMIADQVHESIQSLIETRPPITISVVALPCTLHWLAHQLYGDMSRSDELKRLNPALQNPAALQAGTELTTYAR